MLVDCSSLCRLSCTVTVAKIPSLSRLIPLAEVLLRSCEADLSLRGVLLPATLILHQCAPQSLRVPSLLLLQHNQGVVRPMDCQVQEHGASWCHPSYMPDAPQMQHCMELQTCPSTAHGDAAALNRSVQLLAP